MHPWRITFNFYFGTVIVGSLFAFVIVFIPFILIYIFIYGFPPPSPTNLVLRIIQITEGFVIANLGSKFMLKYLKKRYTLEKSKLKKPFTYINIISISLCLLVVLCISIQKYGLTYAVIINSSLVFFPFIAFMSYYLRKRLNEVS